jgi:hypothetical protein
MSPRTGLALAGALLVTLALGAAESTLAQPAATVAVAETGTGGTGDDVEVLVVVDDATLTVATGGPDDAATTVDAGASDATLTVDQNGMVAVDPYAAQGDQAVGAE